MEQEAYKSMFELEQNHWWYKGLHSLLFSTIKKNFVGNQKINVLDAGCGTGYILKCLAKYGKAFGIDLSEVALTYCKKRGLNHIVKASVLEIPFLDNVFDLVISTDVLYHKDVTNDICAINEIYRVLKKGGVLIINLPAHNYLCRPHDEKIHTQHRYNKDELYYKLKENKFEVVKISYHNAFLFIALFFLKIIEGKNRKYRCSDLRPVGRILNAVFYYLLAADNFLLKMINIPFGTSIFCMSKKV